MRFQAKLRNTPPQFGSSRLRGVPCNRAVGTGTKQPTPWTLFPERETENPEFRVGENCRRLDINRDRRYCTEKFSKSEEMLK